MTRLATSILESNLDALSHASPDAVERIRAARPRADVRFFDTDDGVPTAQIGDGPAARMLASRRRPLEEASRLIAPLDIKEAAVFAVAGFGVGYHVAELSRRLGRTGVMMVFEPDVELLRAVLERVDCARWIRAGNICILTDPDDGAAMGAAMRGVEGLVGLGVTLVQHPASTARLGTQTAQFHERFTGVVDSIKMTVITTLVQVRVTMRNLIQNADVYATSGGIGPLAGVGAGRPAIVVSAGPSLHRNIQLLKDPAVRERCVIVAVQTVLRPLLNMGIRPHFVTALDYSEINRRFYEGLTREMVEGITLVVEPKVNPSVLMAWPGKVLCTGDATLDLVLGPELAAHQGPAGKLKQGATVAHLAYYLARHLGCDPVALIGQDLGFTDGQYYAAGASIHEIWAGELNEFKSLELFEWQRIVRMGPHLRNATDTLGRRMYTDSQMHSYLTQFETDFKDDGAKGLTTIDATQGGVHKRGTRIMDLRQFLDAHAGGSGESIDGLLGAKSVQNRTEGSARQGVLKKLRARVAEVRGQAWRVADISRRAALALAEMQEHEADRGRVDRLIQKVQSSGEEVEAIKPGFQLTQLLGQSTVFNRVRADRLIHLEEGASDLERQKLRIQRDIENVRGLERTANELCAMLDGCAVALDGGERITRDIPQSERELERVGLKVATEAVTPPRPAVVCAVVPVNLDRGGLGWARPLEGLFAGRRSVLAATVNRLLACTELSQIVLLASEPARVEDLLEPGQLEGGRVRVERGIEPHADRARAIAAGRLWARACWRGGLGDLTCFDEVFDPRVCREAMERVDADGALVVGPDWVAVDPALCDAVIRRHRENPLEHRLTFTQAAPGLCGCVVARSLAADLCEDAGWDRVWFATIGGVLGYLPPAPLPDLIAQPVCVAMKGAIRDCGVRLIADTPAMRGILDRLFSGRGVVEAECIASEVSLAVRNDAGSGAAEEIEIRTASPGWIGVLRECASRAPGLAATLGGPEWNPATEPNLGTTIAEVKAAGLAGVHIRTTLAGVDDVGMRRLLACGADVVSVDFGMGAEHDRTAAQLERLLALRKTALGHDGLGVPWIVPRLTRCDATYSMVEAFVNRWVMSCGWCTLDPLNEPRSGERIAPLPVPAAAAGRFARIRRVP